MCKKRDKLLVIFERSMMVIISGAMGLLLVLASIPSAEAQLPLCDQDKKAEVLEQATDIKHTVKLDCSLILHNSSYTITKAILISGEEASGLVLDCGFSEINPIVSEEIVYDSVSIRSLMRDHSYYGPSDVTIKNCTIYGRVAISGIPPKSNYLRNLSQSMFDQDFTKIAQRSAPKNVTLDNLTIIATGRTPVYFNPGVTYSKLIDSKIEGESDAAVIYLDNESAHNTIKDNTIRVATNGREQMSIDGSAHNRIVGNTFSELLYGGIYIYRNCGEEGYVRHQWPAYNQIINNIFYYGDISAGIPWIGETRPAIWIGSRNENKPGYCDEDDAYPIGSGANDDDFAKHNAVGYNQITKLNHREMIRNDDGPNYKKHNKTTNYPKKRGSACFLFLGRPIFFEHGDHVGQKFSVHDSSKHYCDDNTIVTTRGPVEIRDFSCSISNSNSGTVCEAKCPENKKIIGFKAGCNLEHNGLTGESMQGIIADIPWDMLKVVRESDRMEDGYCSVSKIDSKYYDPFTQKMKIQKTTVDAKRGSFSLRKLLSTENYFEVHCKEYDIDGGDCVIAGQAACI